MLTLSFLLFEISFWNPAYLYFGKLAFEQYVFLNFNSSLTTLTDQEQGGGNRQGTKSPQKWKKSLNAQQSPYWIRCIWGFILKWRHCVFFFSIFFSVQMCESAFLFVLSPNCSCIDVCVFWKLVCERDWGGCGVLTLLAVLIFQANSSRPQYQHEVNNFKSKLAHTDTTTCSCTLYSTH